MVRPWTGALLVALTLAVSCWGAVAILPDRILTVKDSIRLAESNSPGLLSSQEDTDIALQRVREAESLFFPKLDLNANWSKFRVEGDRPLMLNPELGPTLITNSPQQNFYTARADIYQTVYEGGRSRNLWRQARISYERARSGNEALQIQVASLAKQAFYDLLFAQEKSQQYADVLNAAEPLAQSSSGSSMERLNLIHEVEHLRSDAAQAKLDEDRARLNYLSTLNLELSTVVQLKGDLVTHPVEIDLQKMLAWASQYRSELRQTEYQEELDALGVSLSLAERAPVVGFGAVYERVGTDLGLPTWDWAGTLNISLPVSISDLFYGLAKVQENRAQYRQATLKHAETEDQIQLQVRQAYALYRYWQDELTPRAETYQQLKDLIDGLAKANANAYEKVRAQRLLLEAHVGYEDAVRGHLTALASLERAVGHSLNEDENEF